MSRGSPPKSFGADKLLKIVPSFANSLQSKPLDDFPEEDDCPPTVLIPSFLRFTICYACCHGQSQLSPYDLAMS